MYTKESVPFQHRYEMTSLVFNVTVRFCRRCSVCCLCRQRAGAVERIRCLHNYTPDVFHLKCYSIMLPTFRSNVVIFS